MPFRSKILGLFLVFAGLLSACQTTTSTTVPPAGDTAVPVTAQSIASQAPIAGPTATAAGVTPALTAAPRTGPNKFGVHLLLTDGSRPWPVDVWPTHLEFASRAVGDWGYVVQLITSNDLKVKRWQTFMDLCAQYHLTPIIRLATTFNVNTGYWETPPQDPDGSFKTAAAQYADFLSKLTWPSDTHYVVVGNEPNHGNEWANKPDPAGYARFLIDVADAIHAADPAAKVMNAGFDSYSPNTNGLPAPDGFIYYDEESFMDGMVAAQPDVFKHIDLWASHPYPRGPFISGPWDQTFQIDLINGATNPHHVEPPPSTPNRGINSYAWELFKLSTYGITNLKVMITEVGWRHSDTVNEESLDEIPDITKAKFVANYVHYAYVGNDIPGSTDPTVGWTPWVADDRVVGASIFALDGYTEAWGHTNLLKLKPGGAVIGTYEIFGEMQSLSGG